jgi:predicted kinase
MKLIFESWRKFLTEQKSSNKKIIFMAGGPGAGKSTVLDALGIDYPVVNADQFYEKDLEDAGLSLDIEKTFEETRTAKDNLKKEIYSILEMEDDEESVKHDELMQLFDQAMDKGPTDELGKLKSEYDEKREKNVQVGKIFAAARKKSSSLLADLVEQGKSFIIDGTAGAFGQMRNSKKKYEDMGYETAMIFVDVPLELAIDRQKFRERRLPPKSVESSWSAVSKNKEPYEGLFGDNFFYFLNDAESSEEVREKVDAQLKSQVAPFVGAMTEDFQDDVKIGHSKMKRRIIGTGGNKIKAAPFDKDPSMKRSKSAPPGFGGS